jgi:hypothetical protein
MQTNQLPDHEQLFEEIYGKLQELSHREIQKEISREVSTSNDNHERLEHMQNHLRKSHEELIQAQIEIQEKIKSLDGMTFANTANNDFARELKRISEQLDSERMNNSKLSTDLAKSLELNLKLQFEIEEIRSKAQQVLSEEKKHNTFLQDKLKNTDHELEIAQAVGNETRLEFAKAKERFQQEQTLWEQEKRSLNNSLTDQIAQLAEKRQMIEDMQVDLTNKNAEYTELTGTLVQYEEYSSKQAELMKTLTDVAEKKMIELKLALDRKTIESQDYYSHLQKALTQINVLMQENSALKDYIGKLTHLHQARNQEVRA